MAATTYRFGVLGALEVRGETEVVLTRPSHRRLLSLLLLDRGRDVPVSRLIDGMWGESPPRDPRNTLQVHIGTLRRELKGVIATTATGYRVDVAGHWLDVDEFRRIAAEIETAHVERVVELAPTLVTLWRGEPFPDLADGDLAGGMVESLVETRLRATTKWMDALAATGRETEGLEALERLVAEYPFEERLWERLMLFRYRVGNTAGALRAFQTVRRTLGEELGIEPGDALRDLEERILFADPGLGGVSRARMPHNLPAPNTSFVGRGADVDGVVELLKRHRLVTVTGGPGMGKTRLSLEVGDRMSTTSAVWFVRLVGADSESDLAASVATVTGLADAVAEIEDLASEVGSRPMLLILDNCEHLVPAVARFVARALAVDGPLRVLATSRQRLAVPGEQVWRLGPLGLPPTDGPEVYSSDAMRLLIDRATAADRTFRARSFDTAQLSVLCQRTAGIPLAIEFAATWLPSIGVPDAVALSGLPAPESMDLMDPHHRSMRDAVEWSLSRIADVDRRMVAAASVFAGSFALAAFRAICAPAVTPTQAAGAVSRLVESSFLVPERQPDGGIRYRMLEPVRDHAADDARELGLSDIGESHASWYLDRALEIGREIDREIAPAAGYAIVDLELGDHRRAMRHFLDAADHESAARLATSLTGYWFARYLGWEAMQWLGEALAGQMSDAVRVQSAWTAGWAAYSRADYPTAAAWFEESLSAARREGDEGGVAHAIYGLGRIDLPRDPERGRSRLCSALDTFSRLGMDRERGECLLALGFSAAMKGDVHEAVPLLTDAERIFDQVGSLRLRSVSHRYLSLSAWYSGERQRACHHIERAEELARAADDGPAIGGADIQRALVEVRWGNVPVAAGAVLAALDRIPARNEIDHCLVFAGVFGVLVETGYLELASVLFAHVDRIFAEFGWLPLDVRMPAVEEFRRAVPATNGNAVRTSSADLADRLRPVLASIAAGGPDA